MDIYRETRWEIATLSAPKMTHDDKTPQGKDFLWSSDYVIILFPFLLSIIILTAVAIVTLSYCNLFLGVNVKLP